MSKTLIHGFRGERPVMEPGNLTDSDSTGATDVRIQGGRVESLKVDLTVQAKTVAGTLQSFYKYVTGDFFEWDKDVDVVTTQIGNDSYDRRIFTGDTNPKITYNTIATSGAAPYPAASYLLGVPPPGYVKDTWDNGQKCTIVVSGTADDEDDLVDSRYYVVTSVDVFGAEGPPSIVSEEVEWQPGQVATVTLPVQVTGNYNIVKWRLYRTSTGSSATDFQYVAQGTSGWGGEVVDNVLPENLAEVMTTEDYNLPHDSMIGITAMPGEYLVGHYANILFFSEPGFPHAWPIGYQLNTKTDIVGVEVIGQNMLLVTTTEKPYLCTGTDPANMSLSRLDDIVQACTSKRSVKDVGPGVVYASPDGLMLIATSGSKMLTDGIFSREQWQAMDPTSMECHLWEGLCLVSWDLGTGTKAGFLISPSQPEAGIVRLTDYIDGTWYDDLTDQLYISVDGSIKIFTGGTTYRTGSWASKEFEFMTPKRLSCGRAWQNATGALTVELQEGDGTALYSRSVYDEKPFRLAGGQKRRDARVKFTVTGGKSVHRFELAETVADLRGN